MHGGSGARWGLWGLGCCLRDLHATGSDGRRLAQGAHHRQQGQPCAPAPPAPIACCPISATGQERLIVACLGAMLAARAWKRLSMDHLLGTATTYIKVRCAAAAAAAAGADVATPAAAAADVATPAAAAAAAMTPHG